MGDFRKYIELYPEHGVKLLTFSTSMDASEGLDMARIKREGEKPRLMLQVSSGEQEKLKFIAVSLGFLIPSGVNVGTGNISELVRAIALISPEKLKNLLGNKNDER